jgi:hypothetical protein
MWKRLDESVSLSEKLAGLSWPALGTWMYLAAQTDTMGRFPRDSRIVKAKCMTMRYDVRLEAVEEALLEIERAGLLHCYDADGKAYLVLHNAVRYNPPGALGHVSPKYPEPPPDLCKCLQERRASGVRTPDVTSSLVTSTSSSLEPEPQPEFRGEAAQLAIAWIRGGGEKCKKETAQGKVQAALDVGVPASEIREAFKAAKGQKIWEILDPLRDRLKKSSVDGNKFRQVEHVCQNCGGSGSTVTGPCPGCKKGRELRRAQA